MDFIRYVFGFLYIRNWHTGAKELSRQRLYWFMGIIVFFGISAILIYIAQSPVIYERLI